MKVTVEFEFPDYAQVDKNVIVGYLELIAARFRQGYQLPDFSYVSHGEIHITNVTGVGLGEATIKMSTV